jgi:hypothetical protein
MPDGNFMGPPSPPPEVYEQDVRSAPSRRSGGRGRDDRDRDYTPPHEGHDFTGPFCAAFNSADFIGAREDMKIAIGVSALVNTRLSAVLAELDWIEKRGRNDHHGFEHATIDDVRNTIGRLCGRHGISWRQQELRAVPVSNRVVCLAYHFALYAVDEPNLEAHPETVHVFVRIADRGGIDEKAFSKARSLAWKDWAKSKFGIAAGDDPLAAGDRDPDSHERDAPGPSGPPAPRRVSVGPARMRDAGEAPPPGLARTDEQGTHLREGTAQPPLDDGFPVATREDLDAFKAKLNKAADDYRAASIVWDDHAQLLRKMSSVQLGYFVDGFRQRYGNADPPPVSGIEYPSPAGPRQPPSGSGRGGRRDDRRPPNGHRH